MRQARSHPAHPTVVPVPLTSVDDLLDGFGHLPLEQGVEKFDQEDEAGTEHDEGPSQQHQPHSQVRQRCVSEEVLACPTAWLGEGLGPARPHSQTCPLQDTPLTWTPAPTSHNPAPHHESSPMPSTSPSHIEPLSPTCTSPAPYPPSPAQAPCTHSHFCLVMLWRLSMTLVLQWPGAVQFRGGPISTAAVCRERVGRCQLHSLLGQPLPTTHPPCDHLVDPAGPRAPHLWGCGATPDADEAPIAQALVPHCNARDHRLVQLQQHMRWREPLGADSTHSSGTSSLGWGHHCQPGDTWIQPPSKGHQCWGYYHQHLDSNAGGLPPAWGHHPGGHHS